MMLYSKIMPFPEPYSRCTNMFRRTLDWILDNSYKNKEIFVARNLPDLRGWSIFKG